MADLNATIYAALTGDSALEALVGERVWNSHRSQGEGVPALVFQRISTFTVPHAQGTDGLAGVRYQLDAYASTLATASDVILAARAVILGIGGIMLNRRDLYESEVRLFRAVMDVSVWGTDE